VRASPRSRPLVALLTAALACGALGVVALLAGCGVSKATVTRMQAQVQHDRAVLDAAKSTSGPLGLYVGALQRNAFGQPTSFFLMTPADVSRAIGEYLPYDLPAQDLLGKDGSGRFVIKQTTTPQFLSRNRMKLRLFFQGFGINIRNVPAAYAGEVAKVKDGVTAGVWADLEATAVYYPQTGGLSIRVTCVDVNLQRNNESTYRGEIQRYINERMLDRPIQLAVPPLNGVNAEALFLTGNHVVIQYRQ